MNKKILCNILIYGAIGIIVISWLFPVFGVSTNYQALAVWTVILKVFAISGYLGKLSLKQKKEV